METLPAAPIAPETPVISRKWYEILRDVWTNPGVETFWSILKERDHSATRGLIWIGVIALISGLFSTILIPIINRIGSQLPGALGGGEIVLTALCTVILAPIVAIIGNIISTGIYHLLSRLFNGNGNWSDLVFCTAAVTAPASIIFSVIGTIWLLFSQVQVLFFLIAIIFGIVAVVIGIYVLILNILAIKAVENVSTAGAIVTYFLPLVVVVVLSICCTLTLVPAFVNSVR
jgi:hypothetical protein